MMFFDFDINPPETTPISPQKPTPSNEEAKPEMQGHSSTRENSLSPISQIVAFDEMHERKSTKGEQGWHDPIPGSSVDDGEEKPETFSDLGTQAARSKPLGIPDGEQWVRVPSSGSQHDVTIRSGGQQQQQQPVNSPLKTRSPLEIGVDEGLCHYCGCNNAGSEKTVTGISKPTILEIQDLDDIADPVPKAIMSGIPNFEVTASAREVIQPVPGSWPNHLEGGYGRRTSELEDQGQWKDGAGFPSTSRDLGLLRGVRHLFL